MRPAAGASKKHGANVKARNTKRKQPADLTKDKKLKVALRA